MTRNIDELNNLNTRAEEPEEYFAKMDLPKKEKQRRVEFTKKANEIFDLILVMLLLSDYRDFELYESLRKRLEGYLLALIAEFTTPDDYLIDYASGAADNFIEATKKNESNEWFFSADRALYNAENSANDVLNYDLYMQAIADGKTHKRWITEKDNRVRLSHKLLDGKTIEIRKLFYPGGVPMRFPKDYEYAEAFPRELIGCRCNIKYLTRNTEFEDVTSEYIEKAKPGQGTYSFEKGFADKNGEEKTGMWIFNTFGGNLRFLPENGHPDYMWNNKLWELKTPEEPNGVQKLVHKGLHQIAQNSGGIVLDIQKLNISLDEIEKKALKRIISSSQSDLDLMIIDDRNFLKVLRYVKYK